MRVYLGLEVKNLADWRFVDKCLEKLNITKHD